MKKKIFAIVFLSFATALFFGCASAEKVKPETTAVEPTPTPAPEEGKYTVEKGDTLWKISSQTYGDPFQWPLLFKANRDQIKDPDIIETSLELGVKKDFDETQIKDAVQAAKDTPPYKKHSKPRETLPLKY